MPSATPELQAKFPGCDREAFEVLKKNYNEKAGVFYPKVVDYKATEREDDALDYMFHEWDYGYEPTEPMK